MPSFAGNGLMTPPMGKANLAGALLWQPDRSRTESSKGSCDIAKSSLPKLRRRQRKQRNGFYPVKLECWKLKAWSAHGVSHRSDKPISLVVYTLLVLMLQDCTLTGNTLKMPDPTPWAVYCIVPNPSMCMLRLTGRRTLQECLKNL